MDQERLEASLGKIRILLSLLHGDVAVLADGCRGVTVREGRVRQSVAEREADVEVAHEDIGLQLVAGGHQRQQDGTGRDDDAPHLLPLTGPAYAGAVPPGRVAAAGGTPSAQTGSCSPAATWTMSG